MSDGPFNPDEPIALTRYHNTADYGPYRNLPTTPAATGGPPGHKECRMIHQNGYACYRFTCDHDGCTFETLMSAADQLSASIHLAKKGWTFELNPGAGPAVARCPLHGAMMAQIEEMAESKFQTAWAATTRCTE